MFEPTNAEKQAENMTPGTWSGDAAQGTTDQNAAIIAANQTAGEWTGDAAQGTTDPGTNAANEARNKTPEFNFGAGSSFAPYFVMLADAELYNVAGDAALPVTGLTAEVGDILLLIAAADNTGVAGVASMEATLDDASDTVWTNRSLENRTAGDAADDGTTLSIWTGAVPTELDEDELNITFDPVTPAKIAACYVIKAAPGRTPTFGAVGAGVTGAGTTQAAGAATVAGDMLLVGVTAVQAITPPVGDTDTTEGNWSEAQSFEVGPAEDTGQAMTVQFKPTRNSASQNFNTTVAVARQYATNYITFGTAAA